MEQRVGVLVVQRSGGYKDIPGMRYHFPKKLYLEDILALRGCLVLLYEPRRGGTSAHSGGRKGFVAFAFVEHVWDDPDDSSHAFLSYRMYTGFIAAPQTLITTRCRLSSILEALIRVSTSLGPIRRRTPRNRSRASLRRLSGEHVIRRSARKEGDTSRKAVFEFLR